MTESEKRKAYRREWAKRKYASDPEMHRAYAQEQHHKHRANKLAAMKIYREKNAEAIKAQQKEWRSKNKETIRRNNLKRIGFTPELFDELVAYQNGLCAICDAALSDLPSKHVHADHCHTTSEPRGILCHHCNSAIGLLKEDKRLLKKAEEYLDMPPVQRMKRRKQ